MSIELLNTDNAPAAVGPYSQAAKVGNLLFTSGQIPLVPETGELITDDIEKATRRSLDNLKAVLENAGSSFDKVIKATIFITDMNDFGKINEVYGEYFANHKPARSCVQVAALPKGATVEIELIALV